MREDEIYQVMDKLKKFVLENEQEVFQKHVMEIIEESQEDAFMSGYKYAITILKESVVNKN